MKAILCPTDFSPVAQNALLYATEFAKKSGAELILFHTEFIPVPVSGFASGDFINLPEENIAEIKEKMISLVSQLKLREPGIKYRYVLEEGLVAENIAAYANSSSVDLIIMGTSGASGFEAIFEGSNAVSVMEKANCPVLIIPENYEFREPKLFVYATDVLDDEENTISRILNITSLFNAELELVHVKSEDALELVKSEDAMSELTRKHSGENIRYKIIEGTDSIETIEDYAKSRGDILVMAERKKSFAERLFSRNRVTRIAYHAEVPLLVIHKQ